MDHLYQAVNNVPCIATLRPYEEEFPPLVTQTDEKKITRRPYVIPQGITPHGHQATTLKRKYLTGIQTMQSAKISSMAEQVADLKDRLSRQAFQLDQELKTYIDSRYLGPEFHKKNRELEQVKAQLRQIEMDKSKAIVPQALAIDPLSMTKLFITVSILSSTQAPSSLETREFFREENVPTKDKGIKEGSPAPGRSINMISLDNQAHSTEINEESEEETTETSEETDDWSEEDYKADLSAIAMVNPVEEEEEEGITSERDEPTASSSRTQTGSFEVKTSNKWFTFDDIQPARLQLINGTSSQFLGIIHQEFLGDITIIQKRNSQEYFEMKCCSLNRKDLEKHYKKMAAKYYPLGGNNNPPLKQVFIASLPDELQPELHRMMMALRKEVATTTIGEIYQLALAALDKLCEQQQMFKQLSKNSSKLKGACSKSYLKIKCKEPSTCEWEGGSKSTVISREENLRPNQTDVSSVESKDILLSHVPTRQKKEIKMLQSLMDAASIEDGEDLESVLEEQEVKDGKTEYVFQDSDSEEDFPPKRSIFSISSLAPPMASITTKIPKGSNFPEEELGYLGSLGMKQIDGTPRPHFDLKVKTSIYDKPTKAVALLDTGSCATVLRPHVLPKEMWAPISKTFTAANSEIFTINLISKQPIGLEIFAGQITWLRVLGSYLPDKDVLFGFDAFFRTHGMHIKPTGLTYKGQFLPFLGMQSILEIQEAPEEYREIQQLLISACCDSHDQFNHPAPLWKIQNSMSVSLSRRMKTSIQQKPRIQE
ncbi:polyprotein [Arachis hypogaea]|nr:polyprotein [Arachis hypogaea]